MKINLGLDDGLKVGRLGVGGGGGFSLPYTFTPGGDGALPSVWKGSGTFSVYGGLVVNSPSVGANLLTDPGLEANYTAGKCDTLTKNLTPTLTEENADIHGGSKAQKATAAAVNSYLYYGAKSSTANNFYRYSQWVKGSGTNMRIRMYQAGALPSTPWEYPYNSASAYVKRQVSFIVTANGSIISYPWYENGSSSFQTALMDDGTLELLTKADLFTGVPCDNRLATVKTQPYTSGGLLADGTLSYIWAWGNSQTLPTTYLMAYWVPHTTGSNIDVGLLKCVEGTWTTLIGLGGKTVVAGAWLEIRPVDNDTVALYYNNVQCGSNVDVADVTGPFCGMGITGGNAVQSFFVG